MSMSENRKSAALILAAVLDKLEQYEFLTA